MFDASAFDASRKGAESLGKWQQSPLIKDQPHRRVSPPLDRALHAQSEGGHPGFRRPARPRGYRCVVFPPCRKMRGKTHQRATRGEGRV